MWALDRLQPCRGVVVVRDADAVGLEHRGVDVLTSEMGTDLEHIGAGAGAAVVTTIRCRCRSMKMDWLSSRFWSKKITELREGAQMLMEEKDRLPLGKIIQKRNPESAIKN